MAESSPPTQAQSLRRHLEETSRDLAAAKRALTRRRTGPLGVLSL